MKNQDKIDKFFETYSKRDFEGMEEVMDRKITWFFLGQHPLAGIKHGIDEVISFFDTMGEIMAVSNGKMEKLIIAENDRYVIECQHSKTNREDGNNLEHFSTVLWTFENGKIIEGRHFFADPQAVDSYFTAVAPVHAEK
jgi:ketosteroid isomerase-like protein